MDLSHLPLLHILQQCLYSSPSKMKESLTEWLSHTHLTPAVATPKSPALHHSTAHLKMCLWSDYDDRLLHFCWIRYTSDACYCHPTLCSAPVDSTTNPPPPYTHACIHSNLCMHAYPQSTSYMLALWYAQTHTQWEGGREREADSERERERAWYSCSHQRE